MLGFNRSTIEYSETGNTDLTPAAPAKTQVYKIRISGKVYTVEATSKDEARAIAYNMAQYSK